MTEAFLLPLMYAVFIFPLRRKSEGASYGREKSLARQFKKWVREQQRQVNEQYKLKSLIRKIVRESIRG